MASYPTPNNGNAGDSGGLTNELDRRAAQEAKDARVRHVRQIREILPPNLYLDLMPDDEAGHRRRLQQFTDAQEARTPTLDALIERERLATPEADPLDLASDDEIRISKWVGREARKIMQQRPDLSREDAFASARALFEKSAEGQMLARERMIKAQPWFPRTRQEYLNIRLSQKPENVQRLKDMYSIGFDGSEL